MWRRPCPVWWALLVVVLGACDRAAAEEPVDFAERGSFSAALAQPFSASWENISLREIVKAIEDAKHVAIVVDRRLDPTAPVSLKASTETLRGCLDRLAAEWDAGTTIVGSVVYLGPRESAGKLRTLVALRTRELFDRQSDFSESRRIALTQGATFGWHDLDRPADLVRRAAADYGLEVEGLEQVPHDLWAGGALPGAGAVETLSLLLAQFDLTFSWTKQARGVRLEAIPARVAIERPHSPPRGMSPADAILRWQEAIPGLEARAENGKIVVNGTEELHEVVDRVRRGGRVGDKGPAAVAARLKPLHLQRYNGKITNVPANAVLRDLETPDKGQLTFEYDRAAFQAAGIDLDRRVSLELKNATIEDLLRSLLTPLGLTFEIRDRTVRLRLEEK